MKDQRKMEIKVGITVAAGILIFIWIIGWAKNVTISSKLKSVTVKFANASGLEVGDNVTVNGVRKGNVEDIKVEDDYVLVKLIINNDVNLKKDAVFTLNMVDLMGGKKVEISPGTSPEELDFNKLQSGIYSADIPEVMSMLGSVQGDLVITLQQVKIAVTSLNKYLTDEQLTSDIKTSVKNLSEITEKVDKMIDENRSSIKELSSNTVELSKEAKDFITENKSDISYSVKEIASVLKNTDSLLTQLNQFSSEIKEKKNNVGKIMYDENLLQNLNSSIKQINELTQILLEQLKEKGLKIDAKIHLF